MPKLKDRTTGIAVVAEPKGVTLFMATQRVQSGLDAGSLRSATLVGSQWMTEDAKGNWNAADGTSSPFDKNPPIGGDLKAVFSPVTGRPDVFYVGTDGYLHVYSFLAGKWTHHQPPSDIAVKVQGGLGVAWNPKKQVSQVAFVGLDKRVHQYVAKDGAWEHQAF